MKQLNTTIWHKERYSHTETTGQVKSPRVSTAEVTKGMYGLNKKQ